MILTVGHSNHPIETFIRILSDARIELIADVRSVPSSRRFPQFNRDGLRSSLAAAGVEYLFLGAELGARPADRACWCDGRVDYGRLSRTPLYRSGIERLEREASFRRVAMMCAERDPSTCHRAILVARDLVARGTEIRHLLADGTVQPHGTVMTNLAAALRIPPADMFRAEEVVLADTYQCQEQRIAYSERA